MCTNNTRLFFFYPSLSLSIPAVLFYLAGASTSLVSNRNGPLYSLYMTPDPCSLFQYVSVCCEFIYGYVGKSL